MKKLQQLRAKKGFTLVELIVVIAIIGVLAAILIPTMIGYVKSANITSADQTAASIRKEVANTISSLETKGGTTKGSGTILFRVTNSTGADSVFTFGVNGAGTDTEAKDPAPNNNNNNNNNNNAAALGMAGNKPNGGTYGIDDLYAALKETCEKDLKEVKAGGGCVTIKNGVCTQVAYSSDAATANHEIEPSHFQANGCEEGIIQGVIVGTNPKVYKDAVVNSQS